MNPAKSSIPGQQRQKNTHNNLNAHKKCEYVYIATIINLESMTAIYRNWFDLGNICDGRPNWPEKNDGKKTRTNQCALHMHDEKTTTARASGWERGREPEQTKKPKPQHICLLEMEGPTNVQHGSSLNITHCTWMQRTQRSNQCNKRQGSHFASPYSMPTRKSQHFYRFCDFIYSFATLIFFHAVLSSSCDVRFLCLWLTLSPVLLLCACVFLPHQNHGMRAYYNNLHKFPFIIWAFFLFAATNMPTTKRVFYSFIAVVAFDWASVCCEFVYWIHQSMCVFVSSVSKWLARQS